MRKFGKKGKKILKTLHLIAASCWVGGSIALGLPYILKRDLSDQGEIHGINLLMHHIDVWLVILPGAMGCLLTGIAYSAFTEWGFIKYKWVAIKWIITLSAITSGTFFLGPWIQEMIFLSKDSAGIASAAYTRVQTLHFIFGSIQAAALLIAVWLSVYKPFKAK